MKLVSILFLSLFISIPLPLLIGYIGPEERHEALRINLGGIFLINDLGDTSGPPHFYYDRGWPLAYLTRDENKTEYNFDPVTYAVDAFIFFLFVFLSFLLIPHRHIRKWA